VGDQPAGTQLVAQFKGRSQPQSRAGRQIQGNAIVIEGKEQVKEDLLAYFAKAPQYARYFNVKIDPNSQPNPADCERAAGQRVMVRISIE
jgi:hypothetical protein